MSGGATNDVAIDDPDFWTKVVGIAGMRFYRTVITVESISQCVSRAVVTEHYVSIHSILGLTRLSLLLLLPLLSILYSPSSTLNPPSSSILLSLLVGGVDGLEDNGVRKRKCRDGLTSYKERKDAKNNKKTSEDTSSASEGDSDKSNSDEEGEGEEEQAKGKRSKSSDVGDADWSEMSVVKIARVMLYLVRTHEHISLNTV